MKAVLYLLVLIALSVPASTVTPGTPEATFRPTGIVTEADSSGFVTQMVEVVNTGEGTLTLSSVNGSCGCAGGSVQTNNAVSDSSAKLYLWINTRHFTDTLNHVDFTVASNASNSPSVFRITVTKPSRLEE